MHTRSFFFSSFLLLSFLLLGAGCPRFYQTNPVSETIKPDFEASLYTNTDYGFGFYYPSSMDVKPRPAEEWQTEYLGLSADFFLSVRSSKQSSDDLENLLFFYATKESVDVDQFLEALTSSDPVSIQILETEEIKQGGLILTKVISTTASGMDKIHYLFSQKDRLIILSEFLLQEEQTIPLISTLHLVE